MAVTMRFLFDHVFAVASRLPPENYYDIAARCQVILQYARAKRSFYGLDNYGELLLTLHIRANV